MGTNYNNEIGYESLLADFKRYQKQTPKGVSLQNKRNKTIVLKFKINGQSKSWGCNCSFTLDGMVDALRKANKVSEALKRIDSLTEFEQWYKSEILEANEIKNDSLTFGEAIKAVEDDFWSRPSRTKRVRSKNHPSDLSSYHETYGRFYKHLPENKTVNIEDIVRAINFQKKGTRSYKYSVFAMKKMARINKRQDILDKLDELSIVQTKYRKLQAVTIEEFMKWRNEVLGVTKTLSARCNLETRQAWLWVFSMQVVYGFRISEVFAIQNLDKSFITEDGVTIPALNDSENKTNIAVVGEETTVGTTTKTGYRLAKPIIPPKYPDLIELLNIKTPKIPEIKLKAKTSKHIVNAYTIKARKQLLNWNAPTTETHAFRHLANHNGIQAGIPLEIRAQSLGHTPAMNDSTYKKRKRTQTTIDLLLNSNTQGIDFVAALNEAKQLSKDHPDSKQVIAILIAKIYQKDKDEITKLLD